MTPYEFISKWRASTLTERSASQQHFLDLCELLGEPKPADVDPHGDSYCFERGASKDSGGDGWADVWKRHHFAWEYKGKRKDLDAAFGQLRQYSLALENPPVLIVSDMERFRIRTNWTNSISKVYEFDLADLADAGKRDLLKWALSDPGRLRPDDTRQALTEQAADAFSSLAQTLRGRGHDPHAVAHFVNRLVFCMFAEDVGLLPDHMFTRLLQQARRAPAQFVELSGDLFRVMATGGRVGFEQVAWFNGGLFDDDVALPLEMSDIDTVLAASNLDWSEIDPSILGTLFERGLDPDKRAQLGAHYTDRDKIMLIIEPVVIRPLLAEWEAEKAEIAASLESADSATASGTRTRRRNEAVQRYRKFLNRLRAFTVLDPACGSGNFLYLALQALKDLEHRVQFEAEALGLERSFPEVGPANVKGIEINPYAAELARVSVWIGEIQWMRRNGFAESRDPILKPLDTIECRDAILTPDNTEPDWPEADVVIGNPPFLGGKLLISGLGEDYVSQLFANYAGRVPAEADLVCYWFEKAGQQIASGKTSRVGLVATNSIRGGANRRALQAVTDSGRIFEAWGDEPWVIDGAAVRVSLVCFSRADDEFVGGSQLDGAGVDEIYTDLTARSDGVGVDLTKAARLAENGGVAFMGDTKGGPFDIDGDQAREWLRLPANPNGRTNADVLRPWANGMDVTRRPAGKWIIDFGAETGETEAALYQEPFEWVAEHVRPLRLENRRDSYRTYWWRHAEPRPKMRQTLQGLRRYIATPTVAKHRLFVWLDARVCPDHQLIVVARDDDTTFGILHGRFHEIWSLRRGTSLEDRPRYTPTTTFATFPFPVDLSPQVPAIKYASDPRAVAIAAEARCLVELRDRWLNPPEWVEWLDEPVPGYPKRPVPRDDEAANALHERTLTNLYNIRPQWLADAHEALDAAVAAAYGWPSDISDDDVLRELLALNAG
ncbi:MAG: class I SAM-dependent DNA methyltransferase [Acidimicrobiales bacterium]|nr:class I SAM-dependent DNA methyltransferase [Acidimicrobiales bacterium]MYG87648.1 class I SAM-dependent DNA methyltransferase [Acidimicrobiales bacterium]MYI29296.1 class I SAM-dependent DNA methyltransferase [Acidimicrobiales bacterium]